MKECFSRHCAAKQIDVYGFESPVEWDQWTEQEVGEPVKEGAGSAWKHAGKNILINAHVIIFYN